MRRATFKIADKSFTVTISIHALHEESDERESGSVVDGHISIHALHEESDRCRGGDTPRSA